MKEKKDLDKQTTEETTAEVNETEVKIDVDKLSLDEARSMLKEVLKANDEFAKENETFKTEAAKFKDNWVRTTADYENFKKRNADARRTAYDDGKLDAVKAILLIGDSLDRALALEMDENTKSGVELIRRQYTETMANLGVTEYNPIGEEFTPETCEAIAMVDAVEGETPNTIKSVFKKGYKLNGTKTIRFAQVVVIK